MTYPGKKSWRAVGMASLFALAACAHEPRQVAQGDGESYTCQRVDWKEAEARRKKVLGGPSFGTQPYRLRLGDEKATLHYEGYKTAYEETLKIAYRGRDAIIFYPMAISRIKALTAHTQAYSYVFLPGEKRLLAGTFSLWNPGGQLASGNPVYGRSYTLDCKETQE